MAQSPAGPLTIGACQERARRNRLQPHAWAVRGALGAVGLCFAWSYWPTLMTMGDRWSHDPQYSHGFLVPIFAGVIVWHRRERMALALQPSWWGLAVLLIAAGLRLAAAYLYFEALDAVSLVLALAGLCLLLGGWATLRWMWPAIAFLSFMLPLPYQLEVALAHPLQQLATAASTYCLQTLGFPALAEGNIIHIDEVKLGVAEACSGLGMLMTFFALATAVAIVMPRRWPDRLVIVVSAVPIALIANIARISATGAVHCDWGREAALFLHDWGGWLMMPLALGLLWLELKYLNLLLSEAQKAEPLPINLGAAVQGVGHSRLESAPLPVGTRGQPACRETKTIPTGSHDSLLPG
jgi:exosortase